MPSFEKVAKYAAEKIYSIFGKNSGNMLLATAIIGFVGSSLAQIGAILLNKKYTPSQKAFMVPQEIGECIIASSALFLITLPIQIMTKKIMLSGKFLSKNLVKYMEENKLSAKRGKPDFNFREEVKNTIDNIQKSDVFIRSEKLQQEQMLSKHKNASDEFETIYDSAAAIATTAAGVVTTGIVVPIVRNRFASYYQKRNMDMYNNVLAQRNAQSTVNMKV